jgi:hypothetical protein
MCGWNPERSRTGLWKKTASGGEGVRNNLTTRNRR